MRTEERGEPEQPLSPAAEAQIRNAREKAYAEIREVAIEVAEAASTKLIGGEVAKDRIVQAVDSTREKKA